jgi:3'-phosphoadenosine 5'-phosphosulfate sulfotransferase (PAPS reductase)/FAD synthetase
VKYIVNLSGGLTSFEALRRTLDKHGKANTNAVFADTSSEDPDLYRFLDDQERYFGISILRTKDGRDPWQVMKDEGYITLQGMAPCSNILKRECIEREIALDYARGSYTRVFGYEWNEIERMERLTAAVSPDPTWFPLAEPPYVDKCHIAAFLERIGIAVPRLYQLGFEHNNCSALCVKAGQAHWAKVYFALPERYAYGRGEATFRQGCLYSQRSAWGRDPSSHFTGLSSAVRSQPPRLRQAGMGRLWLFRAGGTVAHG